MSRCQFHLNHFTQGSRLILAGIVIISSTAILTAQDVIRRTTVAPLYTPPATSGVPMTPLVDPSLVTPIRQTQMIYGTPGAMTIPPGGMILSSTPSASAMAFPQTVCPPQTTTVQRTFLQPEIGHEWTFSRIRSTSYEEVQTVNPWTGTVTTSFRPQETESLLPWLHQREVVQYRPVTVNVTVPVVNSSCVPCAISATNPSATIPTTTVIRDVADTPPSIPQSASYPPQTWQSTTQNAMGTTTVVPATPPSSSSEMPPLRHEAGRVMTPEKDQAEQNQKPAIPDHENTPEKPTEKQSSPPRVIPYKNPLEKSTTNPTIPRYLFNK